MITDLENTYKKLHAENATLQGRIDAANEAVDALMAELEQTFHCSTIDEALALQAKLQAARDKVAKSIEDSLASVLN